MIILPKKRSRSFGILPNPHPEVLHRFVGMSAVDARSARSPWSFASPTMSVWLLACSTSSWRGRRAATNTHERSILGPAAPDRIGAVIA